MDEGKTARKVRRRRERGKGERRAEEARSFSAEQEKANPRESEAAGCFSPRSLPKRNRSEITKVDGDAERETILQQSDTFQRWNVYLAYKSLRKGKSIKPPPTTTRTTKDGCPHLTDRTGHGCILFILARRLPYLIISHGVSSEITLPP